MKVLVTGASGFLGWHLLHQLVEKCTAESFCGSYHHQLPTGLSCDLQQLDVQSKANCQQLIEYWQPTHVIHAAAMTSTAQCETDPEHALLVNHVGTANLLSACAQLESPPHFLLVSTDLVFNGEVGNYREEDLPSPIQNYGTTKLLAEAAGAIYPGPFTVVRSSLIYGPPTPHRKSFLQWMLDDIRRSTGQLFDDEIRSPIFVDDLIHGVWSLCVAGQTGIFHLAGADQISRWQFGKAVADSCKLTLADTLKSSRQKAGVANQRPRDVSLCIEKAKQLLGFSPTPVANALRLCLGDD